MTREDRQARRDARLETRRNERAAVAAQQAAEAAAAAPPPPRLTRNGVRATTTSRGTTAKPCGCTRSKG